MTQFYLINQIRVGTLTSLWPGTLHDDRYDPVDKIREAGGWLVAVSSATLAAAAAKAARVKEHGGPVEEAAGIMLAAYTASVAGSSPAGSTVVELPFDATTTQRVLSTLVPGQIVVFNQVTIQSAFQAGSRVRIGTFANLVRFLDLGSAATTTPAVYRAMACELIDTADYLVLTVDAVGLGGTGVLFYEVQP